MDLPEHDQKGSQQDNKILPYQYYDVKTHTFSQLQREVDVKNNLLMGVQNAKLQFLMNQYNQQQEILKKKVIEQKKYLRPEQFDTIFQEPVTEEMKQDKLNQMNNQLREQYYNNFILKPQLQE